MKRNWLIIILILILFVTTAEGTKYQYDSLNRLIKVSYESGMYISYFYDEVRERIVAIYCRHLARKATPRKAIEYYRKAAEIDQSNAARSQIYKKMAERHYDLGETEKAREMMGKAFRINPKMKGARRICENLGIPYSEDDGPLDDNEDEDNESDV